MAAMPYVGHCQLRRASGRSVSPTTQLSPYIGCAFWTKESVLPYQHLHGMLAGRATAPGSVTSPRSRPNRQLLEEFNPMLSHGAQILQELICEPFRSHGKMLHSVEDASMLTHFAAGISAAGSAETAFDATATRILGHIVIRVEIEDPSAGTECFRTEACVLAWDAKRHFCYPLLLKALTGKQRKCAPQFMPWLPSHRYRCSGHILPQLRSLRLPPVCWDGTTLICQATIMEAAVMSIQFILGRGLQSGCMFCR